MSERDTRLVLDGLRELRRRLPPGWTASDPNATAIVNAINLMAPDGRAAIVALTPRLRLEPKAVGPLLEGLVGLRDAATPLVIAPHLSEATQARLRGGVVGYLDLTGNARIVLREPGLFIETQGASEDPNREERPARSLRGAKAGLVARTLIELKAAPGVRELATLTGIDAGYVSRVLSLLDSEALITRGARGRIDSVDWPSLLRRWARDAPLESRGRVGTFLEPRGLAALQGRLSKFDAAYAITGSLAAVTVAPIAPARLATVWVRDAASACASLSLRPTDTGANVILVEPEDGAVFDGSSERDGLRYAALPQVAADLLSSPGRGPQEAEELIAWMMAHEDRWRR